MSEPVSVEQQLAGFRRDFEAMQRELAKMVVGQEDVVEGVLATLVLGGHALIEGVPGLGKTLLVETLADVLQLTFQRIQFTPDLMPSDLLGTYVVMENSQGRRTFEFQKGPLFSHVILADQINRGTPKAQAALLEAMEGQTITVANESFELPTPFSVFATQNPLEMEGTFPLPEPEIDRFLLKLVVETPDESQLEAILDRTTEGEPPVVARIVDERRLLEMREIARNLPVSAAIKRQAVLLVAATHPAHDRAPALVQRYVRYGSSPRGAQALVGAAKVRAIVAGRSDATTDDLRAVAPAALRHRMILNFEGQAEDVKPDDLVEAVIKAVLSPASE